MSRNDGTYKKVQAKYSNPVMLIIDEWILLKTAESEKHNILNCFTDVTANHPLSSVCSMIPVYGMTSLAEMNAL